MSKIKDFLSNLNKNEVVLNCLYCAAVVMGIYAFMVINGDLSEATVKVNHLAKMQQNNEQVISQLSQKIDELQKTGGCGCNKE